MRPRVAVLAALPAEVQAIVRQCAGPALDLRFLEATDRQAIHALLHDADYAVTQTVPMGPDEFEAASRLMLLHKWGTGTDGIDLDAAMRAGVPVLRVPGRNAESVADLTIGLMLAVMRRIPENHLRLRAGHWNADLLWLNCADLAGATVGLIGMGTIGKAVARRLLGFNCSVLYTTGSGLMVDVSEGASYVSLGELLARSRVVSLHCPLRPETARMLGEQEFAAMQSGSFLINTARGEVVDEVALHYALRSGHLAGAAVDVLTDEPARQDHPLLSLDNVVATSHIGGKTRENLERTVAHWSLNLRNHHTMGELPQRDLVMVSST